MYILFTTLLLGIIGSLLTIRYYLNVIQQNIKYRCLKNTMKNINPLAPTRADSERKIELFANFNETFIAFSDNKKIILGLEAAKDQMNNSKLN